MIETDIDHREEAEKLLVAPPSPFDPQRYQKALAHAMVALVDILSEIPLIAMHLKENQDEEEDDD